MQCVLVLVEVFFGINSILFAITISLFQIAFLCIGKFLGSKLSLISNIKQNVWNIISGILLIVIGIFKILI